MESKDTLVNRLYKRNAKRIELLEKQRKLKGEINVSNEQLDYFCNIFKEKSDVIELALNKVESMKENELSSHFVDIKQDLHDLQNFLSTSSFFLKEYNIRKSQDVIQNLQTRCSELETLYMPKKKFGFRNKAVLKKANESSKLPIDVADSRVRSLKNNWEMISCGFSDKTDEKLTLEGEKSFRNDISLSHLRKCVVVIKGSPATLHIDHVFNCTIICGPVSSSVFMDNCKDCDLVLACQQLRCHSSINCNVYLHVTSKAIIEDCNGIQVAPYNLKYEGLEEDFANASLDMNKNNWDKLDDFNWLAAGVCSPNWRVMDENLRTPNWNSYM